MGIIKDCPRDSMEKCTDKYGCQGACKAVEQFEKEWKEESEAVTWMEECADFWEHYTYITESSQEKYDEEAQMWIEKLRTAPPQREWVGLTDDELMKIERDHLLRGKEFNRDLGYWSVYKSIEAKLKEKNT